MRGAVDEFGREVGQFGRARSTPAASFGIMLWPREAVGCATAASCAHSSTRDKACRELQVARYEDSTHDLRRPSPRDLHRQATFRISGARSTSQLHLPPPRAV